MFLGFEFEFDAQRVESKEWSHGQTERTIFKNKKKFHSIIVRIKLLALA